MSTKAYSSKKNSVIIKGNFIDISLILKNLTILLRSTYFVRKRNEILVVVGKDQIC